MATRSYVPVTFTVPLEKQLVPVVVNGRTVSHKTVYFGTIFVGRSAPQPFTVVFDTGSGHLFLPAEGCADEPCLTHRRFRRTSFDSGAAPDSQVSITYGSGEVIGNVARELVCLGEPPDAGRNATIEGPAGAVDGVMPYHCTEARVVLAQRMTTEPFRSFNFDGVLGLSLNALALHPDFHLFSRMAKGGLSPIFSVFLSRDPGVRSEITFGGHDETRMMGPLNWAPVVGPELGYWRVRIRGIRVGEKRVQLCADGDCQAVLDTGTSMLGVPRGALRNLLGLTARSVADDSGPVPEDCRTVAGPPIIFELEGFNVQLEASDYFRPAATSVPSATHGDKPRMVCRASLMPVALPALGPKTFLFGEPVLRNYYTSYDLGSQRVGFALAAPFAMAGVTADDDPKTLQLGSISKSGGAEQFVEN